jgi:hypothetical protein
VGELRAELRAELTAQIDALRGLIDITDMKLLMIRLACALLLAMVPFGAAPISCLSRRKGPMKACANPEKNRAPRSVERAA